MSANPGAQIREKKGRTARGPDLDKLRAQRKKKKAQAKKSRKKNR